MGHPDSCREEYYLLHTALPWKRGKDGAMRKWGIVISVFYAAIVLFLLVPAGIFLADDTNSLHQILSVDLQGTYGEWLTWVPIVAVLGGAGAFAFSFCRHHAEEAEAADATRGFSDYRVDAVCFAGFRPGLGGGGRNL